MSNMFVVIDFMSIVIIITCVVIMMMMLIEFINVKTQGKLLVLIQKHPSMQIGFAALVGLIPGCIGIFAIVSLYTHRLVTFGSLLAAAITGFGDEAFFMYSFIPEQTLILICILFGIALIAGYSADLLLRKRTRIQPTVTEEDAFAIHEQDCSHTHTGKRARYLFGKVLLSRVWMIFFTILFIVGIATGFLGHNHSVSDAFPLSVQTDTAAVGFFASEEHEHASTDEHTEQTSFSVSKESAVFLLIAFLTLLLLFTVNNHFFEEHILNHVVGKHLLKIFIWIFVIMLFVKLLIFFVDIDAFAYKSWGKIVLLLFALLIALLPESGPNLIILFLFMEGIAPFSVLLANSILQEGHGGLPLIAEKPKHFLWLKLIKGAIALLTAILGLWIGF
ncbi:MAG: putative manganese transporter [Bacteroidales bacterium]|jgi:hypothetical protein|nr:putative manganese transporter [Bacteroidales bacterium]